MAIRIGKIARELNVGVKTIFDFLQKKGYEDVPVDNPNYKLSDEQENLLVVEFSQDKVRKEEAMNRMRPKQKSVETKAAVETVEEVEIKIEKPAEPAPAEAEIQIYVNTGKTFVEIEEQGAYTTLNAGEELSWTVRWYLEPTDLPAEPSKALLKKALKMIK